MNLSQHFLKGQVVRFLLKQHTPANGAIQDVVGKSS
jgi:hypothetical protein